MKIKRILVGLVALAMTASLAACGSGNDNAGASTVDEPASEAGSSEPAAEADDDGDGDFDAGDRQVVTIYRANDGNGAVEAVIEAFEAAYPQYAVKWVEASNDTDTVRNQLNTAFAAGSGEFDVVSIDVVWAGDMGAAGYLEPLDSYIMDSGHSIADYNPGSIQAGTYKAKTYALPLYPDFGSLFFRKDIVSEADAERLVSGNYTLDDLIEMAEQYAGEGGTSYGMSFQANQYEGLVCNLSEWTNGFTDVRGGLETMKRIVDSATATPENILVYQESETANSFVNGETVFSRNWPYQWGLLVDDVTQDMVEIASMPQGNSIGGWLLAMNAYSADKDAAWALLDFFTAMEGQTIFCGIGGYVPGFNAAVDDPAVLAANELLSKPGFQKALENTIARPSSDKYAEMSDGIQISAHKYLNGDQDIDTTVAEIEALLEG